MGFFGSLWSGIKSVAKTAAAVVAAPAAVALAATAWAVDKVDKLISPSEVKTTKSEQRAIQNANRNFSQSSSLNSSSSLQQVENIADSVRNYRNAYRSRAERIEQVCQKYVDTLIFDLIDVLKKDERIANDFGIESIERKQRELGEKIRGAIVRRLESDVSTDNYECRQILQMSKGSARDRRMEQYVNDVFTGAKNDLAQRTGKILNDQVEDIADFLQTRLARQERKASEAQREFERWEREMQNNTFDAERESIKPAIKLYAMERIEQLVDEKAGRVA